MPMASGIRPLLLGHRGARALKSIPENTFASFDRALADGGDGFEFDVRLTADAVPVICHDPRFEGIEIAQASAERFPELPRLESVLDRYRGRAFLDIELKVPGLESITARLLHNFPLQRVVVSSFLPEVLQGLFAEDPNIPQGLICEKESELSRWKDLPIEYVIPHHKLVALDLIAEWKRANKKILVWTVNSPARMRRLKAWGVDGIISDNPKLLVQTLSA